MAAAPPPQTITAHWCPKCGNFKPPQTKVPRTTNHYPDGAMGSPCNGTFEPVRYTIQRP